MASVPDLDIKIQVNMEQFKKAIEEARFQMMGLNWTMEAINFKLWREREKARAQ